MNYRVKLHDSYDLKGKISVDGIMYIKGNQVFIRTKTEDLSIAEWITKGWIFDIVEKMEE